MDSEALKTDGDEMLKYISEFWNSLRERQVLYSIKPGNDYYIIIYNIYT